MSRIKALSSPYNFVPLHEQVFLPNWGQEASHDIPFKDGLNAEIHYTLNARSPLLVGGGRAAQNGNRPQQVHPFKMGNGEQNYAIPGSSLKGMLRACLEIAGFGRMRFVDDRALSVRDLTPKARPFYGKRMTETKNGAHRALVRSGWIELDESGIASLTPCAHSRVEQSELEALSDADDWATFWSELNESSRSRQKYEAWDGVFGSRIVRFDPGLQQVHRHSQVSLIYSKAERLGQGATEGTVVFTGQAGRKHMEFLFHSNADSSYVVDETVWRQFLQIHEGSDEWAFWRHQQRISVFYLGSEDNPTSVGLAQMFRLAYGHTIGETLDNTSEKHRQAPGIEHGYDLADLLFGSAGDNELDTLRARVIVETALLDGMASTQLQPATVLSSPKPGFYPAYVEQSSHDNVSLKSSAYATFSTTDNMGKPRIRGFKRYPARPIESVGVQRPADDTSVDVQVRLEPLEKGTKFRARILCHNLKPEELGALLWVMTFGGREELNHSLGMGKPFGFGQVGLSIDHQASVLRPNDPTQEKEVLNEQRCADLTAQFETLMDAWLAENRTVSQRLQRWEETPQLANLLAMACPEAATEFEAATGSALRYMPTPDLFRKVKGGREEPSLILPVYAQVTPESLVKLSKGEVGFGHPWIDEMVPSLSASHNVPEADVIRGRLLANAWAELAEGKEKKAIGQAIKSYWNRAGICELTTGAVKKARKVYGW